MHPICDIFVNTIAELRALTATYPGSTGVVTRYLACHQASLADQLGTIRRALRGFVLDHQDLPDNFVIDFAVQEAVEALRRDVITWWFELIEETR